MRIVTRLRITTLLAAAISLAACGLAAPPTPALTPVTIQLAWTHQAQFAGLYAADQKGFYAAEGLAPAFIQGGAQIDKLAPLLAGTAQFGVGGADELILARSQGKPVRAIATIYRRSPVAFISLADKGITRPQDFAGKTIRAPSNIAPSLRAMLAKVGIGPDQYTVVDLPSDLAMFASGDVPVWGIFMNVFGVTVQQAGYKLNVIYPDDYGVHFYSDTLFTTDDMIANHPDLVLRFLRATLKGWTYAVENPAAIGPMVLKYAPQAQAALETAKMTASLPLVNTGEDYVGWMKPEVWAGMAQTLREQGVLTQTLDVTQAYTTTFLNQIYGK